MTTETHSPTSTADVCRRCKHRPPAEPRGAYCSDCLAFFERHEAEETRLALDQLVRDVNRLPMKFDQLDVDDHNRAAVAAVKEWPYELDCHPDDEPRFQRLLLHGPVGTGKTELALTLARAYIMKHRGELTARYVSVRELLAAERNAMTRGLDSSPIEDMLNADPDLLILDDVGAERPTEWAVEQLAHIIETRGRKHPAYEALIVTTNYTPAQLAKRLGAVELIAGQRIVSRLREDCLVIKLDGPDRRVATAKLQVVA